MVDNIYMYMLHIDKNYQHPDLYIYRYTLLVFKENVIHVLEQFKLEGEGGLKYLILAEMTSVSYKDREITPTTNTCRLAAYSGSTF